MQHCELESGINFLQKEIDNLSERGFYGDSFPNSIHSPEAIKFFQSVISDDPWCLDILKNGLKFDFISQPKEYYEPNNNSALNEMERLRKIIYAWEAEGKIIRCSEKPFCCNPMSLIKQTQADNTVKYRPVIDCSRMINKIINFDKVKLDDIKNFESLIQPEDYFCAFDLSSMYHHVKLNSETYKYQGFSIVDEHGQILYFYFNCMMFGLSNAVSIVTKLLRPVRNYLRSLLIRFNIYIDDGIVASSSKQLAEFQINFTIKIFKLLGWQINYKKSNLLAKQQIYYLGFNVNSVNFKYSYPERKVMEVKKLFKEILNKAKSKESIKVRLLASLLGKCCAMRKSHGSIIAVMSRKSQHICGKVVYFHGWDASCYLDDQAIKELEFLYNNIDEYNGTKIFNRKKAVKIFDNSYFSYDKNEEERYSAFVSDSSESHSFVYQADKTFQLVEDFIFSETERNYSSGHRELLSVLKMIKKHEEWFKNNPGLVYWATDSQNVVAFLNRGSRKIYIQQDIFKLNFLKSA